MNRRALDRVRQQLSQLVALVLCQPLDVPVQALDVTVEALRARFGTLLAGRLPGLDRLLEPVAGADRRSVIPARQGRPERRARCFQGPGLA